MQQWNSYHRALPSRAFCFTSLVFHQWSFTCEPNQALFFPLSNNYSTSLVPSWEHFSYLGANGLQSTCSTFPQHPRVKGFTPPRNLPVTCSFVVRPRATRTIWKPVRPMTGIKNNPATHMTAIVMVVWAAPNFSIWFSTKMSPKVNTPTMCVLKDSKKRKK